MISQTVHADGMIIIIMRRQQNVKATVTEDGIEGWNVVKIPDFIEVEPSTGTYTCYTAHKLIPHHNINLNYMNIEHFIQRRE